MKLHYYPETDSLYIELKADTGDETREIAQNIHVDLNKDGHIVGIDIDHASKNLDLDSLETVALPLKATKAA